MKYTRGNAFHPIEYRYFQGDDFPASFYYNDKKVQLNTSFKTWLRFDQLLQSTFPNGAERMQLAIALCVESVDEDFPAETLQEGLVWFHGADSLDRSWVFDAPRRKNHKAQYEKMLRDSKEKPKGLSLFWDTAAIWSSFLAAFKIDLYKEDMHWWRFLHLLTELPENCAVNRLIRQRMLELKNVPASDKSEFVIRQHLCAVPRGGAIEGDTGKNL